MVSHFDFIIGRGRKSHPGGLNLPLHPKFSHRNVVFIDADKDVHPDVCSTLRDVDFACFGIDNKQDIDHSIQLRFMFDVSSAFCGGIQSLHGIFCQLRRPFEVFIPLNTNEFCIPSDMKRILWQPVFQLCLVHAPYPLLDWNYKKSAIHVNPNCYVHIMINMIHRKTKQKQHTEKQNQKNECHI